jgi:SAM-dependent methyltransferase
MGSDVAVAASNADQAHAWDGSEGAYWAAHADRFERAMTRYNSPFLAAADIRAGARVIDIGCGTGDTTRAAARLAGRGSALGVDLSGQMIEAARHRAAAENISNAQFIQADAQIYPFPQGAAQVVISRTGAMFFGDAAAAFTNLARALRPGGRLVLLVWQPLARNEWIRAITAELAAGRPVPAPPPGSPGPFSMSDPGQVRGILAAAGFGDTRIASLAEPMYFGPTADDAHQFITGLTAWMLQGLDDDARRGALAGLRTVLGQHETPDGVLFGSAAWLVTAMRS